MRRFALLLILLASAVPATAQSEGRVAAGVSIGTRIAPNEKVGGDAFGVGLLWRLGHGKEGFGWEGALNWFSSNVEQSFGDTPSFSLGKLHTRPFMVGYGYSHLLKGIAMKGSVEGGYAFTSFDLAPSAANVYQDRLGARSLSADVANTFVVRPQVSIWHDINRKVGMNFSVGYMIARPKLTISTTVGEERRRLRADMLILKVGAVYSVF
jgi:hypothetical protein